LRSTQLNKPTTFITAPKITTILMIRMMKSWLVRYWIILLMAAPFLDAARYRACIRSAHPN
jgi:hypothetical protein